MRIHVKSPFVDVLRLAMASSSKFPVAIAIAGSVSEGHLTFDTKVRHEDQIQLKT